jgi:Tol biopolymer transport system component
MWPTWSPDGSTVAFVALDTLRLVPDAGGAVVNVFAGGGNPVTNEFGPQFGSDGQWIYFTRGQFGSQRTIWRAHPDGSAVSQVSEIVDWGIEGGPSPEPDGEWLAYQTNRVTNSTTEFSIRTISTSTGTVRALDVPGRSPRWSPDGQLIAYLGANDELYTMTAGGTVLGPVGAGVRMLDGFAWSPDGVWVVGVGVNDISISTGPQLVNVLTGLVLPLPLHGPDGQEFEQLTWHP